MAKTVRRENFRDGLALLAVLFVIIAVTLISLGFLARSDRELACAANVPVRMQMDYLSQSGLEHAKAFIINPQDVDTSAVGYWEGGTGFSVASGDEYYDITIVMDDSDATNHSNYTITSHAYQLDGADKISSSILEANLRLDPCIALWTGQSYSSLAQTTVNGDVFCNGDLSGTADINGDAFATGNITATDIQGDSNASIAWSNKPIRGPMAVLSDFYPLYVYEGTTYSPQLLPASLGGVTLNPSSMTNPAGIFYRDGNLELTGNIRVYGTLVVKGELRVYTGTSSITSEKNYPAVISNKIIFKNDGQLTVDGLVAVVDEIYVDSSCSSAYFDVTGGVFIYQRSITINGGSSTDIAMRITAAPETAALLYDTTDGRTNRWTPAGGGFYKKINRLETVPEEGGGGWVF